MSNRHFCDLLPDDCPPEIPRIWKLKDGTPATLTGAWFYPAAGEHPPLLHVRYDGPLRDNGSKPQKELPWWHCTGFDQWKLGRGEHSAPLYGLEHLRAGEPVILCEGEKCTNALRSIGANALGLAGVGDAASVDLSPLDNAPDVVLWPDNDVEGRKAMGTIGERLGRRHRRVDPTQFNLQEKGDAVDLIAGLDIQDAAKFWELLTPVIQDVPGPPPLGEHPGADWLTVELPQREFVFEKHIPLDAATFLVAHCGIGKSFLSLQMAVSAATGLTLPGFGCFKPTAGPSRVALVCLEDDRLEFRTRLQRIGRAFNLGYDHADVVNVDKNIKFYCMTRLPAIAESKTHAGCLEPSPELTRLADDIRAFSPRLIVFDPLAAMLGQLLEENRNEDAYTFIGILREVMPSGSGLLVVCHTSKAEKEMGTSPRGGSGWEGAVRQTINMRPVNTSGGRILGDDKLSTVALSIGKANWTAKNAPVYLKQCTLPEFGGVFKMLDLEERKRERRAANIASIGNAILEALPNYRVALQGVMGKPNSTKEDGDSFIDEIISRCGESKPTKTAIRDCVKEMLANGALVQVADGQLLLLRVADSEREAEDVPYWQ
jgi:hypothetical protein